MVATQQEYQIQEIQQLAREMVMQYGSDVEITPNNLQMYADLKAYKSMKKSEESSKLCLVTDEISDRL